MAYKFQIGNFRSGGNIQMAGGTSLSGSITNSTADDATVDAIVAEIDAGGVQADKLALDTNGGLQAQNISSVERLQIKLSGGAEPGLSGLSTTGDGLAIRLSASSGTFGDSGLSLNPEGLFVSINGQEGLITASGRLQVRANANKSVEAVAAGVGVLLSADKGLSHDGTSGLAVSVNNAAGVAVDSSGLKVTLDGDALQFTSNNIDLKDTIAGNRTFTGQVSAQGDFLEADRFELRSAGDNRIEYAATGSPLLQVKDSAQNAHGVGLTLEAGKSANGGASNQNGGNVVIRGGQSKGNGNGGRIEFQVATGSAAAGTLNSTAPVMEIQSNGNVVVEKDMTIRQALTVDGNLTVLGSTVTLSASNLLIEDKIIQVAKDANNQASSKDSGILFGQASADGAQWLYEVDGSDQILKAKQGTGNTLIKIQAAEFMGPATQGQILDEENVATARLVLFADNTGAQDFKSDGDFTYNSGLNGGTLSAPRFAGDGRDLTNVPPGVFAIENKNATAGTVALANMAYNILGNGGQGNGTHKFQIAGSFVNGDEIKVKVPSDATAQRVYQITASAAYTMDGASVINLASPDAAVTFVYVGGNQFKIF